jgi:hypothetical protein
MFVLAKDQVENKAATASEEDEDEIRQMKAIEEKTARHFHKEHIEYVTNAAITSKNARSMSSSLYIQEQHNLVEEQIRNKTNMTLSYTIYISTYINIALYWVLVSMALDSHFGILTLLIFIDCSTEMLKAATPTYSFHQRQ